MTKLPQIKPRPLVKFFTSQGFVVTRQVGSHARLAHADGRKITIAIHNQPIAPGTLQSILKQANLDRNTFLELFNK